MLARLIRTKFTLPLSVAILFLSFQSFAKTEEPELSYSKQQSETAVEIVYRLYATHFNKQKLDDELSEAFLGKYLEALDPGKMFFYQKDIDSFKTHALKFDDYFQEGNLDTVYSIYSVYQQRVESRLETVLSLLKNEEITFNFEGQDSINLDRKDSPWITTTDEADDLWYRRIKLSLLNLKMSGKELSDARETVAKRYSNQLNRIKQEKSEDVFEVALNALTTLFDPHTNYWLPRTSENFNINMSKSLEGIGAVLQLEDEFTKVVRLVAGGPAARAGELKAADRIVAVGQGDQGELVDVVGWRLDEVVDLIRGPKNTVVKLEVLPAGEVIGSETQLLKISRGKVKLEDQEAQKAVLELPSGNGQDLIKLGIVQLPDFYVDFDAYARRDPNYKSSTKDVRRLVNELKQENVDGLVLDLRNNGGGSLQEATMLTDLFIDRGVVVQIKTPEGRVGRHNQAYQRALYDGPLIVLVNRLSASASEIFAGAIQDYGRGLILGSRSFGKGTVQSVNSVNLGQLKLTESKFYRVSGDSTQHRGVVPDIQLPSLIDEEEVGESSYENALPWDQIKPAPHIVYSNFTELLPQLKSRHENRVLEDPDFVYLKKQIQFAEENESSTTISLNESTRLSRKDRLEQQSLILENARRSAKGLEIYESVEDFKKSENESEEVFTSVRKIDVDGDTLLIESGNILIDYIQLTQPNLNKKLVNK